MLTQHVLTADVAAAKVGLARYNRRRDAFVVVPGTVRRSTADPVMWRLTRPGRYRVVLLSAGVVLVTSHPALNVDSGDTVTFTVDTDAVR